MLRLECGASYLSLNLYKAVGGPERGKEELCLTM